MSEEEKQVDELGLLGGKKHRKRSNKRLTKRVKHKKSKKLTRRRKHKRH